MFVDEFGGLIDSAQIDLDRFRFLDVTADDMLTARDALLVINRLRRGHGRTGVTIMVWLAGKLARHSVA